MHYEYLGSKKDPFLASETIIGSNAANQQIARGTSTQHTGGRHGPRCRISPQRCRHLLSPTIRARCLQQVDKFKMALKTVDVTFQNLDSSEISLTDVSHYYDSDPTKVVSSLRDDKKKPSSFMADTTTANAQVRAVHLFLNNLATLSRMAASSLVVGM